MFPYGRFGYVTGFGYSSSNEYSEASSKYSTQSSEKQVSRHGNSCCVVAEFTVGTLFLSFTDSVFHARVENSIKLILAINIDYTLISINTNIIAINNAGLYLSEDLTRILKYTFSIRHVCR